jgi:hypothetical protein
VIELALASHTAPRDWWGESTATVATALDVLEQRNKRR